MTQPGWMPSPTEALIFHAALNSPASAIQAWQTWTQQVDLVHDDLDDDTFRLLSLVYENIAPHLPEDPLLEKLKGISRYHWTKTQLALAHGSRAVTLLQTESIPTLLLKGAALIGANYVRSSSRMMYDFDLLIPDEARERALALLYRHGWQASYPIPSSRYPLIHSLDLKLPADGTGLDLHWFALAESCSHGSDDDFWQASVPITIKGVETRRLSDSDLCFHILAHGARWDPEPSHRWISDTLLLLRSPAVIDWDRVCADAEQRELALLVAAMLVYVRDTFAAPVPTEPITRLQHSHVKIGQRIEFWARNRQRARWRGLAFHAHRYWRLTHGSTGVSLSLVRYFRDWWGVARTADLPAIIVAQARQRRRKAEAAE